MQPLPERERLGVRVVDAEGAHAVLAPEQRHLEQRVPQPAPVARREVERVDVLVALGRVLGVLDRAVGPVAEPLGVLAHPGVVGRALEGQVERDLDLAGAGGVDQRVEVVHRAQLGVDRGVAAVGRADGPRAAGVAGVGLLDVVRPLAERRADRVDGRQVHDVEAVVGQIVEARGHVGQRAGARPRTRRAGEQLVPGGEQGARRIDGDRHRRRRLRGGGREAGRRLAEVVDRLVDPGVDLPGHWSRQVARSSIQARMRKSCRPTSSGTNEASHRSRPGFTDCITTSTHFDAPGGRCDTTTRRRSWPSANTRAPTTTGSPTTRLTGCRPPSTTGVISSITIRLGGAVARLTP